MLTIILSTLIAASEHPMLGITVEGSDAGVRIVSVSAGSPAASFARSGDRITSINAEPIDSEANLAYVLSRTPPGRFFPMVIERDGVASTHAMMLPISAEQPIRYASAESRPTTGRGLLIPGAIFTGVGAAMAILAGVLFAIEDSDDDLAARLMIGGVGGGLLIAGIPMTIVGAVRLRRYHAWAAEVAEAEARPAGSFNVGLSMTF